MSSVFLSHNSKDKPWVRKLAERLTSDGVIVWLDEAEINIDDSLIEKISSGIHEMNFVAAIISSNSIDSSWVQKEISIAMSKEIAGRVVTVLPLLIEQCTLPASLLDKLYADFTDPKNFEAEYAKLLRAIGIKKATTARKRKPSTKSNSQSSKPLIVNVKQDTDISIVGIVKERTRQDPQYSGLQDYYLQLSKHPPSDWEKFFIESRRFPRHTMWRKAWLEYDCIVIKCAVEELDRYHVKDLKQDVVTANENCKQARINEEAKRQIETERLEQERIKRDQALDNLDFS